MTANALKSPPKTRLADLLTLAQEPSSERRRELLREVTDLFFVTVEHHDDRQQALFDDVMSKLAADMEAEVREELSRRVSTSERAPRTLVRALACDDLAIARPLLQDSPALKADDLIHVVSRAPQAHLKLVSARSDITAAVSDAIIKKADDDTLQVLVRNDKAELSREGSETVVNRALENPALHEAVVSRKSLPLDLLNEMYFVVENRLRETITQRNAGVDPETLEAALAAGRRRVAEKNGAYPADFAEAEADVKKARLNGGLTPSVLVSFLRSNRRTAFLAALAELSDLDFHTASRIVDNRDLDSLAIVCKAADFDKALFLTFAVLISDKGDGMGKASEYGRLFTDLPKETALRAMRFWRMRRATGDFVH